MKKILLSLSALALLGTAANAELLVGVEYSASSSMTLTNEYSASGNTYDHDFSYQPIMFKVGLGEPGEKYMYLYYQSTEKDYTEGGAAANPLNEIGYDYVGQFDVGVKNLSPFWQFGAAYGWEDGVYADADSRASIALKIGAGASYYVLPQVELVAGANYQYRIYQDVDYISTVQSSNDSGVNIFIGVNVWPFATGSTTPDAGSFEEVTGDTGAY